MSSELCHAIRSRHANEIPNEDFILYKDNFYRYTFDRETQRIYCVDKTEIEGNEYDIALAMEVYNVRRN